MCPCLCNSANNTCASGVLPTHPESLTTSFREAPVRFGSVTVRGWNGSSGSDFRFRRFHCKKGFSVFQYLLTGKFGSGFGSWKTVLAVPVPLRFQEKRFRRFRFPVPSASRDGGMAVARTSHQRQSTTQNSPLRQAEVAHLAAPTT